MEIKRTEVEIDIICSLTLYYDYALGIQYQFDYPCDVWFRVLPLPLASISELFYRWKTKVAEGPDLKFIIFMIYGSILQVWLHSKLLWEMYVYKTYTSNDT